MWFIHTLGMTAVEAQLSHTTQFPVDRSRHGYGLRRGSPLAAVPPRWCGPDLSGAAGNLPGRSVAGIWASRWALGGYPPAAPRRTQDLRGARAFTDQRAVWVGALAVLPTEVDDARRVGVT